VADTSTQIPDRELFKASEVCEIAGLQPYVLRSWESEFPSLGVARTTGGQRVYRRADVERVLLIKELVFGQGLTLAGARRRIEDGDLGDPDAEAPALVAPDTRKKLAAIRQEMRSLLELLGDPPEAGGARTSSGWPGQAAQPTLLDLASAEESTTPRAAKSGAKSGGARRGKV